MMKTGYPLWRSLGFWAGVLVMSFIVWSWWDSTGCISVAIWRSHAVDVRDSGVVILYDRSQSSGFWAERMDMSSGGKPWVMRLGRPGFVREEEYAEKLASGVPMDQALRTHMRSVGLGSMFRGGPRDSWACFIPHWVILLVAAVVWAGLLGWRWRRWRRMGLAPGVEIGEAGDT